MKTEGTVAAALAIVGLLWMFGAPIYEIFFKPGPTPCDEADQARGRVIDARLAVQSAHKDLVDDENQYGPLAYRPDQNEWAERARLDRLAIRDAESYLAEETRALLAAQAKCDASKPNR